MDLSEVDTQKVIQGAILFLTTATLAGVGQIIFDLYSSDGKLSGKVDAPITRCPEPCKDIVEEMKENQCGDECQRRVRRIDKRLRRIQDLLIEDQIDSEHGMLFPFQHYSYPAPDSERLAAAASRGYRSEDSDFRDLSVWRSGRFEVDVSPKFLQPIERN